MHITYHITYHIIAQYLVGLQILPICTKLNVIVTDKPKGMGGTISTCKSIFMSFLCTIYHQNKRFETLWEPTVFLYQVKSVVTLIQTQADTNGRINTPGVLASAQVQYRQAIFVC